MRGHLEVGVIKFYPDEDPPIKYHRIEGMYIFFVLVNFIIYLFL
jgi:hypothetical protein